MAVLVACGGGDLLLPAAGEPARIEIVEGDGQAASVGTALAEPVVALVSDGQGRPVVGVPVAFAFDDGSDATVAPDTMVTGSDGEAAFQVMMGTRVGAVGAEVRVSPGGGSGVLSAPVSLTALSADANVLTEVSGDQQRASVGAPLPEPLVVRVTDGFGNPIAGVTITWTADAGGTLSDETTVTGPDGSASVERTLGPGAGTQHTLASAGGLSGSPVTFTHTAMAGAAAVLELVSGDGQSALAGTALPDPLVVRAHDADGNPVADLPVTWVVGEGGGGLAPATSATDADGRASTRWTLGPSAGRNTATAVISGVGTVGFTATGDPGAPPGLTLEVQPSESAVRGVVLAVQPVVQLREPDGSVRRKAGVNVTVSLVPGGATIRGTLTRATNAEGRAEFHDLALQGPPGSYALAFSATNYTGVTSHSIGLARAGTTTAIVSDEPDPSAPGVPVRVRFRVQSPGGVPDGTVRVDSDDGAICSATVAAGECSLVPVSTGARTLTATYAGGAEFEGSSDAESHLVEALAPTGTTTRITADDPDPSDVGQTVTVRFTVTAASGTPTGTVTVTASGGAETCAAGIGDGSCALTLTAPGERTLTATYAGEGGFAGSSDSDRHTVRVPAPPPAAPSATASSVDVKDASIEINRNTDVKVVVRDANGREIEGVPVVLSATGGGNTISPPSATTNRKGEAKFSFRSAEVGTKALTAVAGGVTIAEQPTVTVVTAPAPSALSIRTQPSATAQSGSPFDRQPELGLRTATGSELESPGVSIVAELASGGGTLSGTLTQQTDKKGHASWNDLRIDGPPGSYTIRFTAAGFTAVESAPITLALRETRTEIVSDAPDPSLAGEPVTVGFRVDAHGGSPTGNVTVSSDGGPSCTAAVSAGACTIVFPVAGEFTIAAEYEGDAAFGASRADPKTHTVN